MGGRGLESETHTGLKRVSPPPPPLVGLAQATSLMKYAINHVIVLNFFKAERNDFTASALARASCRVLGCSYRLNKVKFG